MGAEKEKGESCAHTHGNVGVIEYLAQFRDIYSPKVQFYQQRFILFKNSR